MRIVDLFSGAGGLTFGFYYKLENSKFVRNKENEFVFANEYDPSAARAFRINFPDINLIEKDIRDLKREEIRKLVGEKPIDIIIGGPPCQSFTTIGKRKYDDKARLYKEYYRVLDIIRPKMFLFENVKGLLSMKDESGRKIIEVISDKFERLSPNFGYDVEYATLDAVEYGVPQHRERVFIIGTQKNLDIAWIFPKGNNKCLTIKEAISDLPWLRSGQEINNYGVMRPSNDYQRLMRGSNNVLTCHFVSVYGKKIQTVINNVIQGEGRYYFNSLIDKGYLSKKYRLTSGYKNTYGRLYENRPCTTITHNMSTPSGLRCIHYSQNRALSPREGARIQSFPDWFQFFGTHTEIKTQIGNAVPPLLAMEFANQIREMI